MSMQMLSSVLRDWGLIADGTETRRGTPKNLHYYRTLLSKCSVFFPPWLDTNVDYER